LAARYASRPFSSAKAAEEGRHLQTDYKLFQVADLICTMELIKLKIENNAMSNSEKLFFGNIRDLKKNYLKPLEKEKWI